MSLSIINFYQFKFSHLLDEALTHSSTTLIPNNERLEFIGDRVINLIMATAIRNFFPNESEAQWAKRYVHCVSRPALAHMAKDIGLDKIIKLGKSTIMTDKILADSFEAYVAAIYIDSSYETVQQIFQPLVQVWIRSVQDHADPKNVVQEMLQKQGYDLPIYKLIKKTGTDHHPEFYISLSHQSLKIQTFGTANTIKDAEKQAAFEFVEILSFKFPKMFSKSKSMSKISVKH